MLEFISINPSEYRKDCFNLDGVNCSRWQVDFYQPVEDYDPEVDSITDKYEVSSLHFTAYNLRKETSTNAYKALQKQLKMLLKASEQTQSHNYKPFKLKELDNTCDHDTDPFAGFDMEYNTTYTTHIKSAIAFYELITGKKVCITLENAGLLDTIVYNYYSSIKWLHYPFHEGNTQGFTDFYDFRLLLEGITPLKELLPEGCY